MPKKPPPLNAPKAEQKKWAKELLDGPDYRDEPEGGMKPTDESGKGEKGSPDKEDE